MLIRTGPAAPLLEVLVVEGDAALRATLVALVQSFGVDAHGASDGEEAERLILARRPDLILCDLEMSTDGLELVRGLRRDARHREIMIVAVTGPRQPRDMALARKAGFDGHVVKPVTAAALARLLDRALDLHRARDQDQGA